MISFYENSLQQPQESESALNSIKKDFFSNNKKIPLNIFCAVSLTARHPQIFIIHKCTIDS